MDCCNFSNFMVFVMDMIKYKSKTPPTFMNINGKNYLMPDWIEFPTLCTQHNWKDYVEWERIEEESTDEWTIESSSTSGIYYTVKLKGEQYECDCPGYRFRRKECKHIKSIKNG